jgi:fructose-1,6-bisphosphatase I
VHEFTLNNLGEYVLTREYIKIKERGNIFSPGGIRRDYLPEHEEIVKKMEKDGYKLRYSGGFVPDINQILLKGGGLFMYPATTTAEHGKLRLPFELNPMAYLIEQAGGAATDGRRPILDLDCNDLDQRSPVYIGSRKEVELAAQFFS